MANRFVGCGNLGAEPNLRHVNVLDYCIGGPGFQAKLKASTVKEGA